MLKDQKGIALLEVLIAAIVLGIAVIGLALMFSWGQAFVVGQGDERVGLYMAEQKIESLRALGFAGIATGALPDETLTAGAGDSQSFTRQTTVDCVSKTDPDTSIACPATPTAKRITVTVTPAMRQAVAVTLRTVVTPTS